MKRQYILDGYITFSPSDSTLTRNSPADSTEEPFLLPVPAARLLQTLLEQSPALSSREELLVLVWENYGMKGSIHNLAHYTMILRKAFINLGLDKKVIITVHKKGLMINPLLEVTLTGQHMEEKESTSEPVFTADVTDALSLYPDNLSSEDEPEENTPGHQTDVSDDRLKNNTVFSRAKPTSLSANPNIRNAKMKMKITLAAFIGLVVLACGVLWLQLSGNTVRYGEENIRMLKIIDRCTFYTFNAPTNDELLLSDILGKAAKFPLNCKKDRVIIYTTDAFLGPNISGKASHTSLTVCTESKNLDDMNSCVSHYYN